MKLLLSASTSSCTWYGQQPVRSLRTARPRGRRADAAHTMRPPPLPLLSLRGGARSSALLEMITGDGMMDQSVQAYEWTVNIATAAALVAGASLATVFDYGLQNDLANHGGRKATVLHQIRMFSSVVLTLAFALEIVVVFTATVTGTMLLSGGRAFHAFDPIAYSATQLMHRELEFEYCLIRAGFFQGLLNWLFAIGLRFLITALMMPDDSAVDINDKLGGADTPLLARKQLWFGLGLMFTMFGLVSMMLAFYNFHLSYYPNYASMLRRLGQLAWQRYITCTPARVLPRVGFGFLSAAGLCLLVSFVPHMS